MMNICCLWALFVWTKRTVQRPEAAGLLHKDHENSSFLIPIPQFLSNDIEHAFGVMAVLCYLDALHTDGVRAVVDYGQICIWSISFAGLT